MHSAVLEEGSGADVEASAAECQERLLEIERMLNLVRLDSPLEPQEIPPRLETHRDFLLKEMAWMAADFEVERTTQRLVTRKLATSSDSL